MLAEKQTKRLSSTSLLGTQPFFCTYSVQIKTGDVIEIQFGSKNVRVEVLEVRETVKKEDVESMYKYL